MTIFYQSPSARITQDFFEIRSATRELFPLKELTSIHVCQESPPTLLRQIAKVTSIVLAPPAALVGVIALAVGGSPAVAGTAFVVMIFSCVVAVNMLRSPPDSYELRAFFRGNSVCLLRTGDQRLLGQVCRALLRALERNVDRR